MLQSQQLSIPSFMQWIYNLAERLDRAFKKMVKSYLPNISITNQSISLSTKSKPKSRPRHLNSRHRNSMNRRIFLRKRFPSKPNTNSWKNCALSHHQTSKSSLTSSPPSVPPHSQKAKTERRKYLLTYSALMPLGRWASTIFDMQETGIDFADG